MLAKVQKWGNSLAVRIPRSYARDARIESGSPVDISIRDGKIIVVPARGKQYRLDDLLKGVTKKNLHPEFDTGKSVGRESW